MSSFVAMDEELAICRICFEPETREDEVISPCDCRGSQKFVHHQCLSKWQATVLFQETSFMPSETRHLMCSTCGGHFRGISLPTRKKLLSSVCGEDLASSLQIGSFLVASRSNSERAVSAVFPALVAALFKLKRAHWKYSVYFIISYGVPNVDDLEGEAKVFALNLTRVMNGSSDRPIPDEVLTQQHLFEDSNEKEEMPDGDNDCNGASNFPRVTIKHHNGGPVKWSSYRSGMLVVERESQDLQELLRQRGLVSDADAATRSGDPAAVFLTSFLLIPLSLTSCLVVGKFSIVMEIVQAVRHLFADGSEIVVFSYSGYAEWTKAQLLREVARGSWGVVGPETALIACEELVNPSPSAYPSAYPSMDEMSSIAQVASHSVRQSCNAGETEDDDEGHQQTNTSSKTQECVEFIAEDLKVLKVTNQDINDDEEDDFLPPIPKPVRMATRGSTSRARSASNTAASASGGVYDDVKEEKKVDANEDVAAIMSTMWREMFSDLEEENIWRTMIDISKESGDNLIRQSYS